MVRTPRIHYPNATYHIILRGNGDESLFFGEEDYRAAYALLHEGTERFHHRILAFCLMPNHMHFAMQVTTQPLSRILQNFSFRYTRHINRRKNRRGHLFSGRYKALVVENDKAIIELVRHIHLNPVQARIASSPGSFAWSSYHHYLGKNHLPWLSTFPVLGRYARDLTSARQRFKLHTLMAVGSHTAHKFDRGTHHNSILGDRKFVADVLQRSGQPHEAPATLEDIIACACALNDMSVETLAAPGKRRKTATVRALVALLVVETQHLTLTELAPLFKRDLSTLSQAAGRLQRKLPRTPDLAHRYEQLKETLHSQRPAKK